MTIKLEPTLLAWVNGYSTPQRITLTDPVMNIFEVCGWLYSDNGHPLPSLFPAPIIGGTISRQAALDYKLITEYDPNAGYMRRDEDGQRK